MKRNIFVLIFLLVGTICLNAQIFDEEQALNKTNALADAVKTELDRSFNELKKDTITPYFISYQVIEKYLNRISASFGKITLQLDSHKQNLDIDLRVGNNKLDNTHLIRGNYDFGSNVGTTILPLDDDETAIRNAIWYATDRAFRRSIEKYEKAKTNEQVKVAAEDTSADFSNEKPTVYKEPFRTRRYYNQLTRIYFDPTQIFAIDTMHWTAVCKRLSEKFVPYQWLFDGDVTFSSELLNKLFVNTEGSDIRVSESGVRLMVNAKAKAEDGMVLPLYLSYFGFTPADLPSEDEIAKDIDSMIVKLNALRSAPMAVTFTGPALLSGEAAGVFFHEIFGHRVEGFREKDPEASNTFKQMVGKKILPDFMDVTFDPTLQKAPNGQEIAGYYKFDDEGIKAQKVVVVKDGVFENFLMSRSPIEGFNNSNGHGRKSQGRSVVTRQSNLLVTTQKPITTDSIRKMLITEAKKQNKEYGLYFKRVSGGFTTINRFYPNAFNVLPLEVYKIYVDGRPDELVRGVDLIGTPLTTFSNIIAAADDYGVFNGMCGAESGWVPVSASSPTLLVSTIEVQKKSKSQAKLPILPSPVASDEGIK